MTPGGSWPGGPSSEWTSEEQARAATYGVCLVCGSPRQIDTTGDPVFSETAEQGRSVTLQLVCPNGHEQ